MSKLALVAGAALVVLSGVGPADAQFRYRPGYNGGGWGPYPYAHRGRAWRGGAVAAGVVGGLVIGGLAAAAATPQYGSPYGYPPGAYGPYAYPERVYRPYYGYRPAPFYGPGVTYSVDPYAAPHEIRDGYRTVYRPGYGRVIIGAPPY